MACAKLNKPVHFWTTQSQAVLADRDIIPPSTFVCAVDSTGKVIVDGQGEEFKSRWSTLLDDQRLEQYLLDLPHARAVSRTKDFDVLYQDSRERSGASPAQSTEASDSKAIKTRTVTLIPRQQTQVVEQSCEDRLYYPAVLNADHPDGMPQRKDALDHIAEVSLATPFNHDQTDQIIEFTTRRCSQQGKSASYQQQ